MSGGPTTGDRGGAEHGAHTDFSDAMSYGDYLGLDTLLAAQHPRSPCHDELLFIVQHQTTELWMKLVIHELMAARAHIAADDPGPAFKMLARVARVMAQLIQAWDVLSTLTPSEYTAFRDHLGRSSGFQSYQYRTIEFLLGNKQEAMIAPHRHRRDLTTALEAALRSPSLYDEAVRALARRGLPVPADRLERDWSQPYVAADGVRDAWLAVYRDPERHWSLYELAEKLVDLEDAVRQWRFRHVTTVERVIGFKRGTGGTPGVAYLRRMLDVRLFPELWDVRTSL
ncbi:tryptophan 2,3-dioxygenase [Azospirillum halopraeferens]|uniref:tryptophan 2,3-dioxygenase n=1 Tax=Azospirillum halopraeferens TaxID=34010 RepID=UPI0004008962|nr:tryptophan 2,3-dioxygenase [Azospirillum halopraeferens]